MLAQMPVHRAGPLAGEPVPALGLATRQRIRVTSAEVHFDLLRRDVNPAGNDTATTHLARGGEDVGESLMSEDRNSKRDFSAKPAAEQPSGKPSWETLAAWVSIEGQPPARLVSDSGSGRMPVRSATGF